MQYEYAISDTAIAEKKLSLFAATRDAFTVVVVLHLEPSRKSFFGSFSHDYTKESGAKREGWPDCYCDIYL